MKEPKVHFRGQVRYPVPACGQNNDAALKTTVHIEDVTCSKCLMLIWKQLREATKKANGE